MRKLISITIIAMALSVNAYAQECREPKLRTTFKENFKRIGVSEPDLLEAATTIVFKSPFPRIQWVGLYWEGPVSGALLAYDCRGKLLSTQRTRGILSLRFFNAPSSVGPAIAVEEVATGTGLYDVEYSIYSLTRGRIVKLWSHTRLLRDFALPSEDGRVESFEFIPSGPSGPPWRRMSVEGIRKIYPAVNKDSSDYWVEKVPTEYYCWSEDTRTYLVCR